MRRVSLVLALVTIALAVACTDVSAPTTAKHDGCSGYVTGTGECIPAHDSL